MLETVVTSSSAVRVSPFAGQATRFRVELYSADGKQQAWAETPASLIGQTEPDRELWAFLMPPGKVVSVVDKSGVAAKFSGRVGMTASRISTGEVLFVGGADYGGGSPCGSASMNKSSNAIDRFDPVDGTVTEFGKLGHPRSFHTAQAISLAKVAVAGGYVAGPSQGAVASDSVELIRTDMGSIRPSPHPLLVARARHCSATFQGKMVLAGGVGKAGSTLELWDPAVGSSGGLVSLSPARHSASCAVAIDPVSESPTVFVAGGESANSTVNTVNLFAYLDGQLQSKGTLTMPSGPASRMFLYASGQPFQVVVAGGFGSPGGGQPLGDVFRHWLSTHGPSVGWQKIASLSSERGCAAGVAVNGKIVLAGGMGVSGEPLAGVDIVDLQQGETPLFKASLPLPRAGAVAVALDNGVILMVGGVQLQGGVAASGQGLYWFLPTLDPNEP